MPKVYTQNPYLILSVNFTSIKSSFLDVLLRILTQERDFGLAIKVTEYSLHQSVLWPHGEIPRQHDHRTTSKPFQSHIPCLFLPLSTVLDSLQTSLSLIGEQENWCPTETFPFPSDYPHSQSCSSARGPSICNGSPQIPMVFLLLQQRPQNYQVRHTVLKTKRVAG